MSVGYLVLFKNIFFPEILLRERSSVRPAFHFLFSPTCIGDLLASGHTDLDLTDGRFWENAVTYEELGSALPFFEEDYERVYALRHCHSERDLAALGLSVQKLSQIFHSADTSLSQRFIPFLGPLKVIRNAIPHIKRSCTFAYSSSLLAPDFRDASGSSKHKDQTSRHFPLSVDIRSHPKLLNIPQGFQAKCRLRINLYPYGLCTIFIVISLQHYDGLNSQKLLNFQDAVLNAKVNGTSVRYANHYRGSTRRFFDWIEEKVSKALLCQQRRGRKPQDDVHRFVCLDQAFGTHTRREQLGLLLNTASWKTLSEEYVTSNPSFFGRYSSEFAHATSTSLLMSLALEEGTHKKKVRVRFMWNFLATYHFILAKKIVYAYLVQRLGPRMKFSNNLPEPWKEVVVRVATLVEEIESYQSGLLSPHRKFFYQLQRVLKADNMSREVCELFEKNGVTGKLDAQQKELGVLRDQIEVNTESIKNALSDIESARLMVISKRVSTESEVDSSVTAIHNNIRESLGNRRIGIESYGIRIVDLIGEEVWASLANDAKEMLMSGEFLVDLLNARSDYSSAVIEYCKAVEVQLNYVFIPELFSYLSRVFGSNEVACGRRLLRMGDRVTLGAMPYLIAPHWTGKLSGRSFENRLYDNRRLSHFYRDLLSMENQVLPIFLSGLAGEIQDIAELRNQAAHSSILGEKEATQARLWWREAINMRLLLRTLGGRTRQEETPA